MLRNPIAALTGSILLIMPMSAWSSPTLEINIAQAKPRPRGTSVGLLSEHRRLARRQYDSPIEEALLALSHQDGYNNEQTIARGKRFCEQMEAGNDFANDLAYYLSSGAGDDPPVDSITRRENRKLIAYSALRGFCTPGQAGVRNRTGQFSSLNHSLKSAYFPGWN